MSAPPSRVARDRVTSRMPFPRADMPMLSSLSSSPSFTPFLVSSPTANCEDSDQVVMSTGVGGLRARTVLGAVDVPSLLSAGTTSCTFEPEKDETLVPLSARRLSVSGVPKTATASPPLQSPTVQGGSLESRKLMAMFREDGPGRPISQPLWHLFTAVFSLATPISVSQMAQFSIMIVMLAMVGHIGVHEMGGASIAFGLLNATAFAFSSGLCGALETLLSQTFGHDPTSKLFGLYTQRMAVLLLLTGIPLMILLWYVEPALLWMGEPASAAKYAGRFCQQASLFAVYPTMALELLRRYLVSQRRPNPVFVAVLAAALVNPVVVYSAVQILGYDGVAIAYSALMALMDIGLLMYLWVSGIYRATWSGWSLAALRNWGPLLRLGLPSLAMALSEFTSLEVNSVVAGFGTPTQLAAYAVSSQLSSLCWAVPSGVYMAATVLVGNSIGSGYPFLAKQLAKVTTVIAGAIALVNVVLVMLFRRQIALLFTDDEAVVDLFSAQVAPWMCAFHFVDTFSCNILSVLRGCGMQTIGMCIILVAVAFVGTPMGVFLFLRRGVGVEALWIGPFLGCLCVAIPAYIYVVLRRIKWSELKPSATTAEDAVRA